MVYQISNPIISARVKPAPRGYPVVRQRLTAIVGVAPRRDKFPIIKADSSAVHLSFLQVLESIQIGDPFGRGFNLANVGMSWLVYALITL